MISKVCKLKYWDLKTLQTGLLKSLRIAGWDESGNTWEWNMIWKYYKHDSGCYRSYVTIPKRPSGITCALKAILIWLAMKHKLLRKKKWLKKQDFVYHRRVLGTFLKQDRVGIISGNGTGGWFLLYWVFVLTHLQMRDSIAIYSREWKRKGEASTS